jgi:hypothetical protein
MGTELNNTFFKGSNPNGKKKKKKHMKNAHHPCP